MAKRVLLGKARYTSGSSDTYGLWVSKPTIEVYTTVTVSGTDYTVLCDREDMLFDTGLDYGQVIAKGSLSSTTNISVTTRSGVDPYVIAKGYTGTTISTRWLSTDTAASAAWFIANGQDCAITYSSGTVTITPSSDLSTTVNYIVFQGTT